MTRLRRFTPDGLGLVERRISQLSRNLPGAVHDVLYADEYTEVLDADIGSANFHTRYDMAQYLVVLFGDLRLSLPNLETDSALWSWIAVHWLQDAILNGSSVVPEIGAVHRWILRPESWKTYRKHLVAAPFAIMDQHRAEPEITRILLSGSPMAPGGAYDRASANQQIVLSPGALHALTALYVGTNGQIKPGSVRQGDAPGTIPRFIKYLNQLGTTHDIRTIPGPTLLDLLPAEFERFQRSKLG